jgi:16S rRNA (guanine527-N7)-methyltransferase
MDLIQFWTILSANGIVLDEKQRERIERYTKELLHWNRRINLISRKDEDMILESHILHSLSVLKFIDLDKKYECMDIGTGGGLPGIPIAIASPKINMLLVDSIKKKVKTTKMLAQHTGMKTIKTRADRVEVIASEKEHQKKYDFIFARGVARLNKIQGWVSPLIKPTGKIVLLKGGDLEDEIKEATNNNKALRVEEHDLELIAYPDFAIEDKKILICTFDNK